MRVVPVNENARRDPIVREAAELLRAGRLVAFPTETVYGLGANALDARAVERIYDVKGRPPRNPIIVHVANTEQARALALEWTAAADAIAKAFWPGPVTLVVKKRSTIPDVVTAGLDTVGVRVPAHPVALALLEEAQLPIAAPSANLSTQLSPTTAQHVARAFGDRVDLVLDGGPTSVGIESTVVDATGGVPRVLRPGMIAASAIARVVGAGAGEAASAARGEAPRSPGLLGKHYAPRAKVRLFAAREREAASAEAQQALRSGRRVGGMLFDSLGGDLELTLELHMPGQPEPYARALYAALHTLDDARCDLILLERPPEAAGWDGIRDRLERAAER